MAADQLWLRLVRRRSTRRVPVLRRKGGSSLEAGQGPQAPMGKQAGTRGIRAGCCCVLHKRPPPLHPMQHLCALPTTALLLPLASAACCYSSCSAHLPCPAPTCPQVRHRDAAHPARPHGRLCRRLHEVHGPEGAAAARHPLCCAAAALLLPHHVSYPQRCTHAPMMRRDMLRRSTGGARPPLQCGLLKYVVGAEPHCQRADFAGALFRGWECWAFSPAHPAHHRQGARHRAQRTIPRRY